MNWRHLYTSFDGRINRKPFWLASIALFVVVFVLSIVVLRPLSLASPTVASLASFVVSLALLYPACALGAKRLHDRAKSGRLMVVFAIPGLLLQVGNIFGLTMREQLIAGQAILVPNALGMLLGLLAFAVGVWALVVLGFLKGTDGANSYGIDPLGGDPELTASAGQG